MGKPACAPNRSRMARMEGVDIWLYLQHASKPMIVQCKHWSRKVAVDDVRAFFGVLKSHDLERGIFATSATFTSEASAFAGAHRDQRSRSRRVVEPDHR